MNTVKMIDDNGTITVVGTWELPPLESLVCAIEQQIKNNLNTWDYDYIKEIHGITETKNGYSYAFGENSVLYVKK
ncbi:hypothetical protein BH753_gp051 [Bacillus phage Shbh1]|uniref:Uncharacterized protein n=1 Tax=Bacillus phage Shbh1 TaxID=1796992 RepID=A0A142F176_9CAUD|nr:hypothetical protein BH753_gp051 [Bacillus phage Shbh1]AMQ66533.1 hypothetical protein [Bacillus phage Shbh1]